MDDIAMPVYADDNQGDHMTRGNSDLHDIGVALMHETEKAYLVTDGEIGDDGKPKGVWLPKSQCELDKTTRPLPTLTGPEWLLKSKGLI